MHAPNVSSNGELIVAIRGRSRTLRKRPRECGGGQSASRCCL